MTMTVVEPPPMVRIPSYRTTGSAVVQVEASEKIPDTTLATGQTETNDAPAITTALYEVDDSIADGDASVVTVSALGPSEKRVDPIPDTATPASQLEVIDSPPALTTAVYEKDDSVAEGNARVVTVSASKPVQTRAERIPQPALLKMPIENAAQASDLAKDQGAFSMTVPSRTKVPHTILRHRRLPYATVQYPTVIKVSSTVAIAIPDNGVASVVLRRVDGSGSHEWITSNVKKNRATFSQLVDGVYDVFYLAEPVKDNKVDQERLAHQYADRRIIVESDSAQWTRRVAEAEAANLASGDRPFLPTELRDDQSNGGGIRTVHTPLSPASHAKSVMDSTERGWDLLAKGSYYAALRQFQTAIIEVSRGLHAVEPGQTRPAGVEYWKDVLDGHSELAVSIRSENENPLPHVAKLAAFVEWHRELAWTFHGLGKTYEAIGESPKPLLRDAEGLAVLAYMTAVALDSEATAAANDLGILCYRLGWLDKSHAAFLHAAEYSREGIPAYNLGRACWELGNPQQAQRWWKEAIRREPDLGVAHVELARFLLRQDGMALYASDCVDLVKTLDHVIRLHAPDSSEGLWANSVRERLALIGREIQLNEEDMLHRHWRSTIIRDDSKPRIVLAVDADDSKPVGPKRHERQRSSQSVPRVARPTTGKSTTTSVQGGN